MTKHEIAKAHYKGGVTNRRTRALKRLEAQLKTGSKTTTGVYHIKEGNQIPLTDEDKIRINKEITILKSKI